MFNPQQSLYFFRIFLGILCFILIAYSLGVVYFSYVLLHPKTLSVSELHEEDKLNGFEDVSSYIEKYKGESFTISSENEKLFGYSFNGNYDKTMIIVHGHTLNSSASLHYVPFFLKQGYNVIVYDQPYHGKSTAKYSSFGVLEKDALHDIVLYTTKKFKNTDISLYGWSLGAATILMYAGSYPDDPIQTIIADSSFAHAKTAIKRRFERDYGILSALPLVTPALWYTKTTTPIDLESNTPIHYIDKIDVPILYLVGTKDTDIPNSESKLLYHKTKGAKEFRKIKGAIHGYTYHPDVQDQFEKHVSNFLSTYDAK